MPLIGDRPYLSIVGPNRVFRLAIDSIIGRPGRFGVSNNMKSVEQQWPQLELLR